GRAAAERRLRPAGHPCPPPADAHERPLRLRERPEVRRVRAHARPPPLDAGRAGSLRDDTRQALRSARPGVPLADTGYVLLGEIVERTTGRRSEARSADCSGSGSSGLTRTYLESLEARPRAAHPRAHQHY